MAILHMHIIISIIIADTNFMTSSESVFPVWDVSIIASKRGVVNLFSHFFKKNSPFPIKFLLFFSAFS